MTDNSDWQRRLAPLLSALTEGELDDAGCAALDDILSTEPEARRFYARYLFVHAALSWKQRGESALPARSLPPIEVAAPEAAVEDRKFPAADPRHASRSATTVPAKAAPDVKSGWKGMVRDFGAQPFAAAVLILALISGAVLIWQLSLTRQQPVVQQPAAPGTAIARLTRSVDASWELEASPSDGAALLSGQKLNLKAGLAEISFDSGAGVILEGPAELILGSEKAAPRDGASQVHNACELRLGKLVARVPRSAHGFTVVTSSMKIVDLGTEFGVAVSHTKAETPLTRIRVFEGKVAIEHSPAAPAAADHINSPVASQKPRILGSGEAVTSDGSGPLQVANADPTRFVREFPTHPRPEALPVWPQDSPLKPGDIVAVTFKSMKVLKINPETGDQQLLLQGRPYDSGQNDHGVSWHCAAVAPDGTLVVGMDGLNGKHAGVLRIDPKQRTIKVLASGGLLTMGQVSGVAVATDGTIYAVYQAAVHNQPEHILRIDPVSGAVSSIARMDLAHGICMAGQGHDALLTSDRAMAVSLMHEGAIAPWVAADKPGRCLSAAVAPDGRIFVTADPSPALGEYKILEVARLAGHDVRTIASLPRLPDGKNRMGRWNLAVESDGRLIVSPTEQDLRIYRVNPKSGESVVVSSGNLLEGRTAVTVVPKAAGPSGGAPQK